MAYSKTNIVNMALVHLGVDTIDDIDNPLSESARKAKAIWGIAFDSFMEYAEWSFAKKTVVLSRSAVSPVNDVEFLYKYTMPSDLLRIIKKKGVTFGGYEYAGRVPYTIRGGFLYTSWDDTSSPIYITYIKKMGDDELSLLSPGCVLSLSYLIASLLSNRMTKLRKDLTSSYYAEIVKAEGADRSLQGNEEEEEGSTSWIDAGRSQEVV
jgi:hypothetical protein